LESSTSKLIHWEVIQVTELNLGSNWLFNSIKSSVERIQKSDSVDKGRLGKIDEPDFLIRVEKKLQEDKRLQAA
jgi:hypothetical protein